MDELADMADSRISARLRRQESGETEPMDGGDADWEPWCTDDEDPTPAHIESGRVAESLSAHRSSESARDTGPMDSGDMEGELESTDEEDAAPPCSGGNRAEVSISVCSSAEPARYTDAQGRLARQPVSRGLPRRALAVWDTLGGPCVLLDPQIGPLGQIESLNLLWVTVRDAVTHGQWGRPLLLDLHYWSSHSISYLPALGLGLRPPQQHGRCQLSVEGSPPAEGWAWSDLGPSVSQCMPYGRLRRLEVQTTHNDPSARGASTTRRCECWELTILYRTE